MNDLNQRGISTHNRPSADGTLPAIPKTNERLIVDFFKRLSKADLASLGEINIARTPIPGESKIDDNTFYFYGEGNSERLNVKINMLIFDGNRPASPMFQISFCDPASEKPQPSMTIDYQIEKNCIYNPVFSYTGGSLGNESQHVKASDINTKFREVMREIIPNISFSSKTAGEVTLNLADHRLFGIQSPSISTSGPKDLMNFNKLYVQLFHAFCE